MKKIKAQSQNVLTRDLEGNTYKASYFLFVYTQIMKENVLSHTNHFSQNVCSPESSLYILNWQFDPIINVYVRVKVIVPLVLGSTSTAPHPTAKSGFPLLQEKENM